MDGVERIRGFIRGHEVAAIAEDVAKVKRAVAKKQQVAEVGVALIEHAHEVAYGRNVLPP